MNRCYAHDIILFSAFRFLFDAISICFSRFSNTTIFKHRMSFSKGPSVRGEQNTAIFKHRMSFSKGPSVRGELVQCESIGVANIVSIIGLVLSSRKRQNDQRALA
jgi:hypothetical protein